MRAYLAIAILTSTVAACSSDNGKTVDAAPLVDAKTDIDVVACATGEQGPITTTGDGFAGVYSPNALTITAGQTVKFVMPSQHNVVADAGGDANLQVAFSETKCLKFKVAGSYKFHCGPHSFKGTVTVQ